MSEKTVKKLVKQALGMEVKHYNNVFSAPSYHQMTSDFGKSNTDKSTYRPDLSLARAYQGSQNKTLLYDFKDGKDTGETVQTFVRSKGLDITEVETAEKRITQIIEDKKQADKDKADELESRKKDLSDLSEAIKNGSSTESSENKSE